MLEVDKLNALICITYFNKEDSIYEKHYIHTNSTGMNYFDNKIKIERPDYYAFCFMEEILKNNIANLIIPFTLPMDNEGNIINSIDVGFKCSNWATFNIDFHKETAIHMLQKNKYAVQNGCTDSDLLEILKNVIIDEFRECFHSDNVFSVVIDENTYTSLKNNTNLIHYLDKINLYKKLQNLEVNHQKIISKIKI